MTRSPRSSLPSPSPENAANSFGHVRHVGRWARVPHASGRDGGAGAGVEVRAPLRCRKRYVGPGGHDLPHHHASVLLSKGVSPALVAERLAHDLNTLLRTYAHVIRQDEDRVRAIVDGALGGDAEDWLRTEVV